MSRPGLLLVSLWFSAAFGWGALRYGAVRPRDAAYFAAALGLGGVLLFLVRRGDPRAYVSLGWQSLLPAVAAVQTIPLPLFALAALSPIRALDWTALRELGTGATYLPLTADPAATWSRLLQAAACGSAFVLARSLARTTDGRSLARLPVLACGMVEASLGIAQFAMGNPVTGTFVNRNHFACLLAITLPLVLSLTRGRRWGPLAAAIPVAAIAASGSRAGLIAAAVGIAAYLRWRAVGIAFVGAAVAVSWIRPGSPVDGRFGIWQDTLGLIVDHKWTGCGLGAFEAAFPRYQTTAVTGTVDFAHNDYLQLVAELGVPLGLGLIGVMTVWLWRASRRGGAGFASAAAFAAHAFFDFNLYIPLNAAAVFWAAGTAPETRDA